MATMNHNPDGSVIKTPEYLDFIAKLQQFHQQRGTLATFDPEPRVGSRHLNLMDLFKIVVDRGGYDKVSDEKLAWRKLGTDLNLGMANLPAQAFTLKSTYYKNLAAYEIKTIHGREPPPKEILEEITAKGGSLLTRTLENYKGNRRETQVAGDDDGDDGTPSRDHVTDETPGSGGRSSRGLRQAPPQRVLFQPDVAPVRGSGTRPLAPPATSTPPQPRGASSYVLGKYPENNSQTVANYEPRPQLPLTLRPVITPGNNLAEFQRKQKALREQAAILAGTKPPAAPRIMLPGSKSIYIIVDLHSVLTNVAGFDGPNIYLRCLMSLKSGIPAEQDYALHHLVKISMERGDKYRFESFAGLAEALVEKCLEVSSLFYDVAWEVSYLDDGRMFSTHTLDGLQGSADILGRIADLQRKHVDDNIQTEQFSDKLLQINEAALTLRNMVMLEENALYVSRLHPLRDFLSIALTLPDIDCVVELKHYALDIAEQLTKYLVLSEVDPLYLSLLSQLNSSDRGAILTALRAISRISMNLEEQNYLKSIPTTTIQKIIDWTLIDDEVLVLTCLDFFYQYTATIQNVDTLISSLPLSHFITRLIRLLNHSTQPISKPYLLRPSIRSPPPTDMPPIPKSLLTQLLQLPEPARSSQWLRSLFEEDAECSITQITLWQSYQKRFTAESGHPLLAAAEFIKNVSTTFADKAAAQVEPGPVQKFIIKGIRIRTVPVDFEGREYTACGWNTTTAEGVAGRCGEFFMGGEELFNHVLTEHVKAKKNEGGKFENEERHFTCRWKDCERYFDPTLMKLNTFASHFKIHLPQQVSSSTMTSDLTISGANGATNGTHARSPTQEKKQPAWLVPAKTKTWEWIQGPMDERGDASGIPLSAVLVLRNLARNIPKTESEETLREETKAEREKNRPNGHDAMDIDSDEEDSDEDAHVGYRELLFKPVERELWALFAENKSLASYLSDLMPMLSGSRKSMRY